VLKIEPVSGLRGGSAASFDYHVMVIVCSDWLPGLYHTAHNELWGFDCSVFFLKKR